MNGNFHDALSSSRLALLDEGNCSVHQLPPYSKVVLTCDDGLKNMKGIFIQMRLLVFLLCPHLRRSGGAVRVVATWHTLTSGYRCFIQGTFEIPAIFPFLGPKFLKPLCFSLSPLIFLSLFVPLLLYVFLLRVFWSLPHFSFLGLVFWGMVSFPLLFVFCSENCLSFPFSL